MNTEETDKHYTYALLSFHYCQTVVHWGDASVQVEVNKTVFTRNFNDEFAYFERLRREGFISLHEYSSSINACIGQQLPLGFPNQRDYTLWTNFSLSILPELEQEGWEVIHDASSLLTVVDPDKYYLDIAEEHDSQWFSAEIGVFIDGEKIQLLPILIDLIPRLDLEKEFLNASTCPNDKLFVMIPGKGIVALDRERIAPVLRFIVQFYHKYKGSTQQTLSLPRFSALELVDLTDKRWKYDDKFEFRAINKRLRKIESIPKVLLPKGLTYKLRAYQKSGVSWLQFLRSFNLAGILADDMGLGKTVQSLAHLLLEKEATNKNAGDMMAVGA